MMCITRDGGVGFRLVSARSRFICLLVTLLPFAADARAQGTGDKGTGTLNGTVQDAAGRAIEDADVIVVGASARARTDSVGRFIVVGVRPGRMRIRVRRIGYRLFEQPFEVRAGAQSLVIELERYVGTLDTVRVRDQHTCDPFSLQGFECRRRAGVGFYRDAGEIRALRAQDMADLFDGVPSIRRVFVQQGPLGAELLPGVAPSRCLVRLWNGRREAPVPPAFGPEDRPFSPDRLWRPNDIVALEVYDKYDKVPERFRGDAWPVDSPQPCVLIVYWTRGAARESGRR